MSTACGINGRAISETPIAILDFETTGLVAGVDRVVEVSVAHVDPGKEPRVVLDTLVNPMRPMAATEIHDTASAIVQFIEDKTVDDKEAAKLRRLYRCLSELGWAPGG